MNKPTHLIAGTVAGGATYFYLKQAIGEEPEFGELLIFLGAGAFVGVLPDVLEPADSPNHRGFFHSAGLCVMGYLAYRKWITQDLPDAKLQMVLQILGAAYGSHLALDACTPRGLPLLSTKL